MKNALISPNESVQYISAWVDKQPVYSQLPNAQRVAEVLTQPFDVAPPLYWVECADDVEADYWYWNTQNNRIDRVPNVPQPTPTDQPVVTGATTL